MCVIIKFLSLVLIICLSVCHVYLYYVSMLYLYAYSILFYLLSLLFSYCFICYYISLFIIFYNIRIDKLFPLPKGEVLLRFASPVPIHSIAHSVYHDIFLKLFNYTINEVLYTASMAELHCSVSRNDTGLVIRLSGFHDKLFYLTEIILNILFQPSKYLPDNNTQYDATNTNTVPSDNTKKNNPKNANNTTNDNSNNDKYMILKMELERLQRYLKNDNFKVEHAGRLSRLIALKPSMYSSTAKLTFLETFMDSNGNSNNGNSSKVKNNSKNSNNGNISNNSKTNKCSDNTNKMELLSNNIRNYINEFFGHMSLDILTQGNLSEQATLELAKHILKYTTSNNNSNNSNKINNDKILIKFSEKAVPNQPIVKLPTIPYTIVLNTHCNNLKEKNIAVELYYQLKEYNVLDMTKLDFLEQLISESFFDTLRTKQQVSKCVCMIMTKYVGIILVWANIYFDLV